LDPEIVVLRKIKTHEFRGTSLKAKLYIYKYAIFCMFQVVQHGLGHMGKRIARLALRKGMEIVAAFDVSTEIVGRDIGEVVGIDRKIGVMVSPITDIQYVLPKIKADVAINATVTSFQLVWEQIKPFVEARMNVISLSEEGTFPWIKYPEIAKEVDEIAKRMGVSIVCTGTNPGFAMDYLPIAHTSGCWSINRIKIKRVVDFAFANPVRSKLRFGISHEKFRERVSKKEIPLPLFTGLVESMGMIADALGWKIEETIEKGGPIISKTRRETPWYVIEPGQVCGFKQVRFGLIKGETKIVLEEYGIVHPKPEDGVEVGTFTEIEGEPSLTLVEKGGMSERVDLGVAARVINSIPQIMKAKPGLLSVKDFPPSPPLPDILYIPPPEV